MSIKSSQAGRSIPLWRDVRVLRVFAEVVFVVMLAVLFGYLFRNMVAALRQQGLGLGFDFLRLTAGFDIGEYLIPFSRTSTYLQAFEVGLLNTALVSALGIVFSTILGVIVGIARLSKNALVQWLARAYIELLRNIPLLVLLIFWYAGFFLKLPRVNLATPGPGGLLLTNRGVAIPWGIPTETFNTYLWILAAALLAAAVTAFVCVQIVRQTGRGPLAWAWALGAFVLVAAIGWIALPRAPLSLDLPGLQGLRIRGRKATDAGIHGLALGPGGLHLSLHRGRRPGRPPGRAERPG